MVAPRRGAPANAPQAPLVTPTQHAPTQVGPAQSFLTASPVQPFMRPPAGPLAPPGLYTSRSLDFLPARYESLYPTNPPTTQLAVTPTPSGQGLPVMPGSVHTYHPLSQKTPRTRDHRREVEVEKRAARHERFTGIQNHLSQQVSQHSGHEPSQNYPPPGN